MQRPHGAESMTGESIILLGILIWVIIATVSIDNRLQKANEYHKEMVRIKKAQLEKEGVKT
jgi:hypothetical protein